MIRYENDLIRLRDARIEDAPALLETSRDEQVMRYYGMEPYKDLKQAEEELRWFLSLAESDTGVRWVIADQKTDRYVGDIGVFNWNKLHNRIELGFKLNTEYWSKGIMGECLRDVLEYCFVEKHINRVEGVVDPRNLGCCRLLEKCGFRLEGLLREYELEETGYVDLQMYGILKSDYMK